MANVTQIDSTVAIYKGEGSPEGSVTASTGDLYLRTDGGDTTTLYIKESGAASNTGWVATGGIPTETSVTRLNIGSDVGAIYQGTGSAPSDNSGNGNDGTWTGTASYSDSVNGIGKAFDFSAGNYIGLPNSTLSSATAWTVCGWVKIDNLTANNASPFGGDFGSAGTFPSIRFITSGNKFQGYASNSGYFVIINSTTAITAGTWYHVALTYDGTVATFYLDGVDDTGTKTVETAGQSLTTGPTTRLGGLGTAASASWPGSVSDVRFLKRAITPAEARLLAGVSEASSVASGSTRKEKGDTLANNTTSIDFDSGTGDSKIFTLTSNVAGLGFSATRPGDYSFVVEQDATGGHTLVIIQTVESGTQPTLDTNPNAKTLYPLHFDGASFHWRN